MTPPTQSDAKFAPAAPAAGVDDTFGFGADFIIDDDGAEAAEGDGAVVVEEVAAPAAAVVPTVGSDSDDARLLKPILGDE